MPVNQPKQHSASHNAALHHITVQTSLNSDGNVSKIDPEGLTRRGNWKSLQASKLIHMQLTGFNMEASSAISLVFLPKGNAFHLHQLCKRSFGMPTVADLNFLFKRKKKYLHKTASPPILYLTKKVEAFLHSFEWGFLCHEQDTDFLGMHESLRFLQKARMQNWDFPKPKVTDYTSEMVVTKHVPVESTQHYFKCPVLPNLADVGRH